MNTERAQVGWRFWLWWVLASTVSLAVLGAVAAVVLGAVAAAAGVPFETVAVTSLGPVFEAVIGAVAGASLGIAQWLVLRRQVSRAGWWVLANTVAFAVGGAVAGAGSGPLLVPLALAGYGANTGGVLVLLLRQPVIEEPSLQQVNRSGT